MVGKLSKILTAVISVSLIGACVPVSINNNDPWGADQPADYQEQNLENQRPADPSRPLSNSVDSGKRVAQEVRPYDMNPKLLLGHSLSVTLDGNKTSAASMEKGKQIWKLHSRVSGTPTLEFKMLSKSLGEFNRVIISISPIRSGKVDKKTIWHISKTIRKQIRPGVAVKLNRFAGVDNYKESKIEKLPAGKYRMFFQVVGDEFDRQYIDFIVK